MTLIPLIKWEVQQDDGQWRELKEQRDPDYPIKIFTLNITIEYGRSEEKVFRLDKYI